MKITKYILYALFTLLTACMKQTTSLLLTDTAPVIVYQTSGDYSRLVPVRLSADGSRVTAYPAPQDLKAGGEYRYPVALKQGFWLDQQGAGPRTAFLKMTYQEYAALPAAPAPTELMQWVMVKQPFTQMYACGKVQDYSQLVEALNELIEQDKLKEYPSLLD